MIDVPSCSGECYARAKGRQSKTEGEEGGQPDCVDGCAVVVDAAEEGGKTAIAGEAEHHAGVGCEGEETCVVDACWT